MEKTTIQLTKETKAELDKLKVHPRQSYEELLANLSARIASLEKYLRFEVGYTEHSGDALEARFLEQRRSQEDLKASREKEKARKEDLVKKILANPPVCEICQEPMKPLGDPFFLVGGWEDSQSSDPTSWGLLFRCSKGSGLTAHGGVRVYPDSVARTPRKKRVKSLGDNLPVG